MNRVKQNKAIIANNLREDVNNERSFSLRSYLIHLSHYSFHTTYWMSPFVAEILACRIHYSVIIFANKTFPQQQFYMSPYRCNNFRVPSTLILTSDDCHILIEDVLYFSNAYIQAIPRQLVMRLCVAVAVAEK